MENVARVYAKTMYIIHYMHDKYYYEKAQMAFVDSNYGVDIAYGIAGISIVADSLSAIKYAKVKAVRDENGVAKSFTTEGEYPTYGNDDDRVDLIAKEVQQFFMQELKLTYDWQFSNPNAVHITKTEKANKLITVLFNEA